MQPLRREQPFVNTKLIIKAHPLPYLCFQVLIRKGNHFRRGWCAGRGVGIEAAQALNMMTTKIAVNNASFVYFAVFFSSASKN